MTCFFAVSASLRDTITKYRVCELADYPTYAYDEAIVKSHKHFS